MYAAITGSGWTKTLTGSAPIDAYSYHRGELLQLKEFIKRNQGSYIVGMISYDLGYELHDIQQTAQDDLDLPDIYFLAFDKWDEIQMKTPVQLTLETPFSAQLSRQKYTEAFRTIKQHIYEGDIYQINLTHRLETTSLHNPRELFAAIAKDTPSQMAAYLEGPDFEILSFSPEKFISVKNGFIETSPIKGTRPLGQEKELLASGKEQAELNMITDLLRNDLGKVCQTGSVNVTAHREIMKLKNISHTYSRITGQLKDDIAPIDALLSMLPGGSITGCPKKRAMEIIDELEVTTRSAYCGCMVTIDPDGNLDSSILIRTIIKKGERLILPVGGGIVNDSDEADEYQETLDKAASITKAVNSEPISS